MRSIRHDDIIIGERIRPIDESHARSLAEDIKKNGLLQPLVLQSAETPLLVIGGHRRRAIQILRDGGVPTYRYGGMDISTNRCAHIIVGDLSPHELLEMELAENILRLELTWQERMATVAKLHKGLQEQHPDIPQTATATAVVMVEKGDTRGIDGARVEVARSAIIAEHMSIPEVAAAKTLNEAWTVVRKNVQSTANRALANIMKDTPTVHTFHKGPFSTLQCEGVSLIISDPPYGIEADTWTTKFKDTPHQYKDDLATAIATATAILTLGMEKWTLDRANLFMCCSPELWHILAEAAIALGWSIWPRPLVWKKSNEGIRPWGIQGFAYTYETILYATKGQKGLVKSVGDVIEVYKVARHNRLHGAQKPVELYQRLIELTCNPGDTILDPTCGSGTIFPAANLTKTFAIGAEQDETLWPIIIPRLSEGIGEPTTQPELDAALTTLSLESL